MNETIQKKSKKGMSEMWWVLATAVIVMVVVIIILVFFRGGTEKLFGGLGKQISGLEDCDVDGVPDIRDACPCVSGTLEGCRTKEKDNEETLKVGDSSCSCIGESKEREEEDK